MAYGIRTYLPGQIDFERRTDGYQIVVFSDNGGIIYVFRRTKIKNRVVVNILIKPF